MWLKFRTFKRNKKKIELFVRDFFKIQLVVNPLRKKNHIFFRRSSMFLLFERIPHKHSSIFFCFVHLNVQNFRHIKKITFFRRIFLSSEKLTFEKETMVFFNTSLNFNLFYLIVVFFCNFRSYECSELQVNAVILTIFLCFSFEYVMDDHKKTTYTNFQIFAKFSDSNGRNRLGMRADIDSLEINTINSLIKKKVKLISSYLQLYFG